MRLSALPCLVLSMAATCSYAATPDTPATHWNVIAKQDVQFAIDAIRSSHAGAVGNQPDVVTPLETNARGALLEAEQAQSERDYKRVMARFIASFADPHTGINLRLKTEAWNGLVLDRIGDQYRVIWSEPGWPHPLPPANAVAQSCDGVWTGSYLKLQVTPFLPYGGEFAHAASTAAQAAMFDNGVVTPPKECTFSLPDGVTRAYALPLRPIADIGEEHLAQVRAHYAAKARPPGQTALANGVYWIGMPDFNGAKSGPAYETLYPQLEKLKQPRWVVFDLRGNGGGDSSWGSRALQALYGKAYSEQLDSVPAYAKYLIASPGTITLFRRYATAPEYAASRDEFTRALQKLESAVNDGAKMAQVWDSSQADNLALAQKVRQRPAGPRIAALINRNCFSSCMQFLQQLQAIGDTVVLGESTWGYSPYGEINRFDLPSGKGALGIPSALYSSLHAARAPFVPELAYPGNLADDAAVMKWVTETLARLKPGQKPRG